MSGFSLQDSLETGNSRLLFPTLRCELGSTHPGRWAIPAFNGDKTVMNGGNNNEEWFRLCEKAAVEKDPEKLLVLCQEISRLLEEKEKMLKEARR